MKNKFLFNIKNRMHQNLFIEKKLSPTSTPANAKKKKT